MKTNEFIKQVEALGYVVDITDNRFNIYSKEQMLIGKRYFLPLITLTASKQFTLSMNRYFSDYVKGEGGRKQLYDLAVEYDRTPVEERGEKRKYQLLPNLAIFYLSGYSLGMNRKSKKVMFPCPYVENEFYQKKFTDTDIKKMPTWVNDFIEQGYLIKEEVKDENEN